MVLLALLLAASPVAEATQEYADLDYEACVGRLTTARLNARDRAAGELLLGLCHFALGHEAQARAHVEAALRREPQLTSPTAAGPKERALVEELRVTARKLGPRRATPPPPPEHEVVKPVEPAPPTDVPLLAPVAPPVITITPPPPPPEVATAPQVIAVAPPRPWWPYLVGGVGLAAAGTAVGFGVAAKNLEGSAQQEPVQVTAARLKTDAERDALVTNVAIAVAGTAVVTAVVGWLVTR